MSRNKSPVVSPQPATSVLRRSARLTSLRGKDLSFSSEPPRKIRPEAKKSPESLRRSLRVSKRGLGKEKSPPFSSTKPPSTPSCSFTLRRSPRFSSGGGRSLYHLHSGNSVLGRCSTKSCGGDGVSSRDRTRSRPCPKTKHMVIDIDDEEEEVSLCLNEGKGNGVRSKDLTRLKTKQILRDYDDEEEVSVRLTERKGNGISSRDRTRSHPRPKTKQICSDCDEEKEEEKVSQCLKEGKRMRITKENDAPKADEGKGEEEEGLKTKNERGWTEGKRMRLAKENADEGKGEEEEGLKTKNERGWTEELELALQSAYLTVKPSPHFWKKVSKMVPGKSAQECFDRVNSDLITPRQTQPRSRAKKSSNLSPIPQFSLSASKLLKPNSPKTKKIRQKKGNLSKKAMRHLVEKQNHMDQGLGFDLFSVLEPGVATSNSLSTPTEKGKSLPRIIESPIKPGSSKDQTTLVSPPVLKQVKNKALHEKYIDHLHVREAKRRAEYKRLVGKENIRPIDNQMNVRAAKDALLFDVQDAMQKLKGLETENSSSSSEFCYGLGETDEEDESI